MGKKRKHEDKEIEKDKEETGQQIKSIADLFASSSTDPALEALFKQNAGPLQPLKKPKPQPYDFVNRALADEPEDETTSAVEPAEEPKVDLQVSKSSSSESKKKSKKRKRKADQDEENAEELESRYLNKLSAKLSKDDEPEEQPAPPVTENAAENATEDEIDEEIDPSLLQHETLTADSTAADKTIFISNLPTKSSTSKPHLKALKALFSAHGSIQSIRFRSIAFTDLVPRKVAFITKKMHPERDTLNAYIVYSSTASVAAAVRVLNGRVWEGKHLRVDSVAHPAVHDHKRCVFVGNLPFDVQDEELWTHFDRCGDIEFVRIVRDKKTNIGKGFGYDRDAVDKAVLLNDKPSATMKRKLRVTYAKKEQKNEVKGNVASARVRLQKRQKRSDGDKSKVIEGKRAKKDKSGGSGFKIGKKHGKMRLLETK